MRDYQTKANQGALPDSITAEKFGAGEANSTLTESKTAVSSSGQTLAPSDGTGESTDQLAKALAIYGAGGAEYCLDTGAADAYVLNPVSPKKAIPALFDGMIISAVAGNENTGASTVNYNSIGVKNILKEDGGALNAGDIQGFFRIRYNLSSDRFELLSSVPFNIEIFTASGSYSKPSGLKYIVVQGVGGGGGSGGSAATVTENSSSEGGAGGGYALEKLLASELSASETVTIGAAGAAGSVGNGDGGAGGNSSFGSHITCNGGAGGIHGDDTATDAYLAGAVGGTATGGDINISGGNSSDANVVSGSRVTFSDGGDSQLGRGGKAGNNALGSVGTGYGSGGGGGSNADNESGRTGVAGQPGIIIIYEFF